MSHSFGRVYRLADCKWFDHVLQGDCACIVGNSASVEVDQTCSVRIGYARHDGRQTRTRTYKPNVTPIFVCALSCTLHTTQADL
jgi:hypothetical protein